MDVYKRLLSYLKPYRGRLILAGLCTLCYTFAHSLVSVTVFIVLNGLQNRDFVAIHLPKLSWLERFQLPQGGMPPVQFPTYWVPFIVIAVFLIRGLFEYVSLY